MIPITHQGTCGNEIICRSCGYTGQAEVIKSDILGCGKLERCPGCRGLNFSEVIVMNWEIDEWRGCYPSSWKGVIVPEAMSHPAKFSSRLIRRIYEHMKAEGWLQEGDLVVDPFAGVALGALDAMRLGLRWRGVELEAKFHELAMTQIECCGISRDFWRRYYNRKDYIATLRGKGKLCPTCESDLMPKTEKDKDTGIVKRRTISIKDPHVYRGNIPMWEHKYSRLPHFGDAQLFHGDSRELLKILGNGHNGAVSSPPYADTEGRKGSGKFKDPEAFAAEQEAKYKRGEIGGHFASKEAILRNMQKEDSHIYGSTPGQLGAMKAEGFDAAISSPPFRHSEGGTPEPKPGGAIDAALYKRHAAGNSAAEGYGGTEGQLANMGEGDFDAAISSPPYVSGGHHEDQTGAYNTNGRGQGQTKETAGYGKTDGQMGKMKADGFDAAVSSPPFERTGTDIVTANKNRQVVRNSSEKAGVAEYGLTDGQLGNDSGNDFWQAARQIVEQVYQALTPGGHAAWVVKAYVKNKELVDFPDQWRQLCEAVGFVTLHEHRALLVHSKGKSHTLEGEIVEHKTESKSFFRRLAEKKGSPRVDWETIYCMVKPEAT